jgi:hypothetical protein
MLGQLTPVPPFSLPTGVRLPSFSPLPSVPFPSPHSFDEIAVDLLVVIGVPVVIAVVAVLLYKLAKG